MNSYAGPKLNRDQLVFIAETILVGAFELVEQGGPIDTTLENRYEKVESGPLTSLSGYEQGAVEGAGMALSIFYAKVTDDGVGAGDALDVSGFLDACEHFMACAWEDEGSAACNRYDQFAKNGVRISEVYGDYYPNIRQLAERFVDKMFADYLA